MMVMFTHDHDDSRMMMRTMVVMIVTHESCMDMMIIMMMVVMITMTLLTYSTDEDEGSEYTRDAVCVCLHRSFVHLRILYQLWIDRQTDNIKMVIIITILIVIVMR